MSSPPLAGRRTQLKLIYASGRRRWVAARRLFFGLQVVGVGEDSGGVAGV